jgi:hypothetical protein
MKKWLKISLISISSLIGLFLLVFTIVCYVLFTPSRLTPLVNRFANEFIHADVRIEKVDLSYFSVYPFVRLNIENILILEKPIVGAGHAPPLQDIANVAVRAQHAVPQQDTLTFIPNAKVKLNFNEFLFKNNLILTQLELRGGVTNVHFSESGEMNWAIFPTSDEETVDTTSTALDSMFNKIDIQQIIVNSGRINYRDEQSGQIATIQNANLKLDGSFIEQNLLSELSVNLKNIDFSDSSMNMKLHGFRTTLKGDLFNSKIDVISEIVMDSLNFEDETMMVFFPNMVLNLESSSNFKDGKVRMNTVVEQIRFDLDNETLLKNPTLKLAISAEYSSENQKISIEKGEFLINEIPFQVAGDIEMQDSSYRPNLTFNLDTTRFSQIHDLLPKMYAKMLKDYAEINDGQIFCNGTITGVYNTKSMPDVDLIFGLKNMDMMVQNSKIDTLNLLSNVKLRLNNLKNSTLTVQDFYYSGHLGTASAKAVVKGFTDNPHIETELHADLNLRRLYVMFMGRRSGYRTRGTLHADLKADFALEDVMNMNLDKVNLNGIVEIDSLLVRNRQDSLNLYAEHARLRFGADADDDGERQGAARFRASVRLDSLDFAYKNLYTANIARFSSSYRYETPTDGGHVNPQSARISFRGMNVRMPQERIRVSAGRTSANIRLTPNPDKPTSPIANIRMSLDSLNFRQGRQAVRLNSSQLNLALMPQNPVVREGRNFGDSVVSAGSDLQSGPNLARTASPRQQTQQRTRDTTISEEERRLQRQQQRIDRLAEMSSDDFLTKLMGYMDVLNDTTVDISQKFLNEFSFEGSLVFDTFRMRMPDFPLPIQVLSTEVKLDPRVLSLNNAQVIMGNTNMIASGSLENFRRALAGRGTLRGNVDLKSNKIDANQLMQAMTYDPSLDTNRRGRGEGRGEGGERGGRGNREPELNRFEQMDREAAERREARLASGDASTTPGNRRTEQTGTERNRGVERSRNAEPNSAGTTSPRRRNTGEIEERVEDIEFTAVSDSVLIAENAEDNSMFEVEFETTEETSLFMIPRLLNLTLNANIDTLLFGKGILTNLHGEAEIRDEFLRLNQFRMTNDAGEMDIALAYRARSLKEAYVWMDVDIEKTEIRSLIGLYPEIEDKIDVVRSLEGLVDLSLTLSTILDSAMNIDMERTKASANLHGQNLVLLDGENFAKIAQTLRFRNRERNLVDSLSVSVIVNDNKIEIFPFKLTMDRYVLAVSGIQNLDMSFNYHITVLQSPIPFTVGFDISGTPDDMNFPRPVRPRLRDLETPATSVNITRTINAQQEFRRLLDHELNQIIGRTED